MYKSKHSATKQRMKKINRVAIEPYNMVVLNYLAQLLNVMLDRLTTQTETILGRASRTEALSNKFYV